ncbi:4Fe-4S binding protein [Methanocaldococcus indicus]|uniref:4Fe-4S binding protein n=1 Tax=Methanocaldococcus indicus TaxID=213231 RepID=UPI003C6D4CA2
MIRIEKSLKEFLENFEDFNYSYEYLSQIAHKLTPIKYKEIYINESKCVRCNLCYYSCPINAIEKAKIKNPAKIKENCVKCEICAQSCPVNAIYVIEGEGKIENDKVIYTIDEKKVPHRVVRLKNYYIDLDKCVKCGICERFCPTKAIKVERRKSFNINLDLCIGCGACQEVCPRKVIKVERYLGEIIKTKDIEVDKSLCVGCFVCMEVCPVNAIEQDLDNKIKILKDKCIYCGKCTEVCPTSAINLFEISKFEKE